MQLFEYMLALCDYNIEAMSLFFDLLYKLQTTNHISLIFFGNFLNFIPKYIDD